MVLGSGFGARAHEIVELHSGSALVEVKVELIVWECYITAVGVGGRLLGRLGRRRSL